MLEQVLYALVTILVGVGGCLAFSTDPTSCSTVCFRQMP